LVVVGPRSVLLGEDYSVFLTARDYYGNEDLELTLTGLTTGEVHMKNKKLGHIDEKITLQVQTITKKL